MKHCLVGLLLVCIGIVAPADADSAAGTIAQLQWQRRVLIVSSPDPSDAEYRAQLRAVSRWPGGEDRDVTVVRVAGECVTGSTESAQQIRSNYRIESTRFTVLLLGKDGQVALRSESVLTASRLEATIDAMPMRRAGER